MARTIEVILSPALFDYHLTQTPFNAVAVDVLRATTAMCAAFQAGAERIIPVTDLDHLSQYKEQGYLTAAERGGDKVNGATYGNSPTEYLKLDLHGQQIAYSTTNGTRCLLCASQGAEHTFIGAFANVDALYERLLKAEENLLILCSGWHNNPSIEDAILAGCLSEKLLTKGDYSPLDDSVWMAVDLWKMAQNDIYRYCENISHVLRLHRMGCAADIHFAFQKNTCPVVPILRDGCLTLDSQ